MAGGISPISSRKMVPWWASSKSPRRESMAPVKAPFSWPKSSLSSTVRRERGHVYRDEGLVPPGGERVHPAREEFLAGARLAGDEHRRVDGSDLHDPFERLADGVGFPHDPGQPLEAAPFQEGVRDEEHFVRVDRRGEGFRQAEGGEFTRAAGRSDPEDGDVQPVARLRRQVARRRGEGVGEDQQHAGAGVELLARG